MFGWLIVVVSSMLMLDKFQSWCGTKRMAAATLQRTTSRSIFLTCHRSRKDSSSWLIKIENSPAHPHKNWVTMNCHQFLRHPVLTHKLDPKIANSISSQSLNRSAWASWLLLSRCDQSVLLMYTYLSWPCLCFDPDTDGNLIARQKIDCLLGSLYPSKSAADLVDPEVDRKLETHFGQFLFLILIRCCIRRRPQLLRGTTTTTTSTTSMTSTALRLELDSNGSFGAVKRCTKIQH